MCPPRRWIWPTLHQVDSTAFFEFGLKAWDVAAGALLVSEAGGAITCIDGTALNLFRGDVMAANRLLEPTLRTEIEAFLSEIRWKPRCIVFAERPVDLSSGRASPQPATPNVVI